MTVDVSRVGEQSLVIKVRMLSVFFAKFPFMLLPARSNAVSAEKLITKYDSPGIIKR